MNDGSRRVETADLEKRDVEALLKLNEALELVLGEDQHDSLECFGTSEGRVWYPGCHCATCLALAERADVAQAELNAGFRSVAITSEVADSNHAPGWLRVAAWLSRETGQTERHRAATRARKKAQKNGAAGEASQRRKRG